VATDAGGSVDAGAVSDAGVAGTGLFTRLAGLWSGPASMTPLGNFPVMSVDFRGVGAGFLFGQTDLDLANTLRFGFSIETHGADVVAYRNGGFFGGVLRDTRTRLLEADDTTGRYRFCSVDRGCASRCAGPLPSPPTRRCGRCSRRRRASPPSNATPAGA